MPALNGVRIMLYDTTHAHEDDRTVIYRHQEGCDRHLLTSDVPVLVRAAEELLKKPRQP
jgi:hypothetical protein